MITWTGMSRKLKSLMMISHKLLVNISMLRSLLKLLRLITYWIQSYLYNPKTLWKEKA